MTLAVSASRRGAFMSLSGCARGLAMGITSGIGGWVVSRSPSGELVNYHWLGWMAVVAGLVSTRLASRVRVNEAEFRQRPVHVIGQSPRKTFPFFVPRKYADACGRKRK